MNVNVNKLLSALNSKLTTLESESNDVINLLDRQTSENLDKTGALFIDAVTTALSNTLLQSYNQVAPLRAVTNRSKQKPWVSIEIRQLMKDRGRAYVDAKRSSCSVDYMRFRFLRSQGSNSIIASKNDFFSVKLENAPDVKSNWSVLRTLDVNSFELNSPLRYSSADALNTHYANVVRKSPPLCSSDVHNLLHVIPNIDSTLICRFIPISPADVIKSVHSGNSKTSGHDELPVDMIKLASSLIVEPLTAIINCSLTHGVFPDS